ncbi:glucosamine-6-phosphate deaminase [Konateibacter massiliensis]|uniref:glucosamine-6-phosphate deaminase n=1 Tax=Konateibacter massiliensis TaxID=2002841 RepID=UPI000C148DFE|nr:glucosamine-6-phosphate deaminase [Konateibacter massiliensis]
MKLIKARDYDDISRKAANILSAQVILKPDSVLGLATGSTPIGIYNKLVDWYKKGDLDFSQVRTVNLDEYCGLSKDNDQSYYYFMNHHLFYHVNIDLKNTNFPNGMEADANKECTRYNQIIEDMGGIDMQLLGIGTNGHIGFNEPNDTFIPSTHQITLSQETINANSRFFSSMEEVPTQAYTMGVGHIMNAKKILMAVSGENKAQILKEVLTGPVTPFIPATILQFHHDVTIVADEAALSALE